MITLLVDYKWENFLPFSWTRPIWDLRMGIFTFLERIGKLYGNVYGYTHREYLRGLFPSYSEEKWKGQTLLLIPTIYFEEPYPDFRRDRDTLFLDKHNRPFGVFLKSLRVFDFTSSFDGEIEKIESVILLDKPWQLLEYIPHQIQKDYKLSAKKSFKPYKGVVMVGTTDIFIDTSVEIEPGVIVDATAGPVFVDSGAKIMGNSYIKGPAYIGKSSIVMPLTKIVSNVVIGPVVKIGGEITNSIIWGYSNKQHDGFLGDSIIAEWVNIGAGTAFSNLKNTYGNIKMYYYPEKKEIETGKQFLGALIGPHAKIGINSIINCGTVMGSFTSTVGDKITSGFIPDFTWIDGEKMDVEKAIEIAQRMMSRRDFSLTEKYKEMIKTIFIMSKEYKKPAKKIATRKKS
ncbi:MAG: putative sugar nucleotidyl transferase [candidate division WOR-3 bacterium]|nr:putative sugar nucleotidyl transferase [candidate division WOR-3 bacterium]